MESLKCALLFDKNTDEYIEDIDFDEYLSLANKNKYKLKCFLNHDLVFCNGSIRKPHFRHKTLKDFNSCYMSKWHLEFQSNFDDMEFEFIKKDERQIKTRRADINLINSDYVVELQHSRIELREVRNRKHDYNIHNKEIIWVIDGNNKINVISNKTNSRTYLEFTGYNNWKYDSFKDYKIIFIDIKNKIYVIFPNLIKNNMFDVIKPFDKYEFIKLLKTDVNQIFKDIEPQCNLYIKQQGAGNGKTFGIIQAIDNNDDFELYKSFIIVSKQHSAKTIIYNEFKEQYLQGLLTNIKDIEFIENENNKQYMIIYNKNDCKCKIVICTIDSLFFKLGNFNNSYSNKFEGLIASIIDDFNKDRVIYNSIDFKLNKNLCLIIDETQDLSKNYGEAIINIMKHSYIDAYLVGDKLQSISFEDNAFVYLSEKDLTDLYIKKTIYPNTNICRRFTDKSIITYINDRIPFNNYNLPSITPYIISDNNDNNNNYEIISSIPIHSLLEDKNKNAINDEINKIIDIYDKEVIDYKREPKDFLVITPFTNNNWFCEALERAIQLYWSNKNNQEQSYKRFVVFHKSETGTSIDLTESEDKTRIVSIHTSKGDGRKVVFIIGMTTNGLLKFSKGQYNLIYDSLIHVALTRQKEKLYIRLERTGDDIYHKLKIETTDNNKIPKISKFIKLNIKEFNNSLYTHIIEKSKYKDFSIVKENKDKKIIDFSHHTIRFCCIYIEFLIKAKDIENKKQIIAIINEIKKAKIESCSNWKDYNTELRKNNKINDKYKDKNNQELVNKTIPIVNLNTDYYNKLKIFMKNIRIKIKTNDYENLCPIERILLLYMIDVCNCPYNLSINMSEIYNIFNSFNNCFNHTLKGHLNCLCKTHFTDNNPDISNKDYLYLQSFYQEIVNIDKLYNKFFETYKNLEVLLNHRINITFNNDIDVYKRFQVIAYNETTVFNIYIKPNLIELNYYEILNESLIDLFLIKNDKGKLNKPRFHDKEIKTIVFALNIDEPLEIVWHPENEYKANVILKVIKDYLYNELKIKTNNFYNIYKNNNYLIKDLLNDLNKENRNLLPSFIQSFFETIADGGENGCITKDKFNSILDKRIKRIINNYI